MSSHRLLQLPPFAEQTSLVQVLATLDRIWHLSGLQRQSCCLPSGTNSMAITARFGIHPSHTAGHRNLLLSRIASLVFEEEASPIGLQFALPAPQQPITSCERRLLHPGPVGL